jgi:NADH-quinone oxidoreductase subunit N
VYLARSVVALQVTPLVRVDAFGLFYIALIVLITGVPVILGFPYLAHKDSHPEEYYVLLLIATAGACVMTVSTHFASFYLGLEVLSVSQYGLVAYVRRDRRGTEAGVKYLVLAAASAAFLVFGMALIYGELGTMSLDDLAHAAPAALTNKVVLMGVAMMLVGIGFKLSIVPFHLWTPDVYEGAPAPVAAYVATVAKIGMLSVLVRYFSMENAPVTQALPGFIALTAAASMVAGNFLALIQTNFKRLLAYSSIAHMGYLSIAFFGGGQLASDTVTFYMIAYSAATIGAFGVTIAASASFHRPHDLERVEDYRGLYWRNPLLAIVLTVSLLSLAGIPLTAGFLGKLYVMLAGAQESQWALLVLLVLSSTVGAAYYLRVAMLLFSRAHHAVPVQKPIPLHFGSAFMLASLAAITLALGTYPAPVLALIHHLVSTH